VGRKETKGRRRSFLFGGKKKFRAWGSPRNRTGCVWIVDTSARVVVGTEGGVGVLKRKQRRTVNTRTQLSSNVSESGRALLCVT